jgi:filamentous hemagglutinin family protein
MRVAQFGLPRVCRLLLLSSTAFFSSSSLLIHPVRANPSGGNVTAGQASISEQGATTTIDQSSQRAAINWQSFNVAPTESVIFNQPGASASTLNRVVAGQESLIQGSIRAPGQVIIENSNGVIFSGSSRIDVGSLIATSAGISDANFMAGKLDFDQPGNPDATVSNSGFITVAQKGLAAFVAPSVSNSGTVTAKLGTVAMAAGNAATIDFYGDGLVKVAVTDPVTHKPAGVNSLIRQGGVIAADGGTVILTANAAAGVINSAINMSGMIEARGVSSSGGKVALVGLGSGTVAVSGEIDVSSRNGQGGTADITGATVKLASSSRIDASSATGGGSIAVGGGLHGGAVSGGIGFAGNTVGNDSSIGGNMRTARRVTVAKGAVIDASATHSGNGGTVAIWAEQTNRFNGTVNSTGAAGGSGGQVETSSHGKLDVGDQAKVTTLAPGSTAGDWLLDPASLTVVASGGSAASVGAANTASGSSTIDGSTVDAALAAGNVTLQATNLLDVEAPIAPASGSSGLELNATAPTGDVVINAPITIPDGNLSIHAGGSITLTGNAALAFGNGTVWLEAASGTITQAAGAGIQAGALGALAQSVSLTSPANSVGTFAGFASNGNLQFAQTNTSGVTTIGSVTDPFAPQSVSGAAAQIATVVGDQELDATSPNGYPTTFVLSAGGQSFNEITFTALPYGTSPPGLPLPSYDSSDYFIQSLGYTLLSGALGTWSLRPESATTPTGFSVTAGNGAVTDFQNQWGVTGFAFFMPRPLSELQYNPTTGQSESLTYQLGGTTNSVTAILTNFYNPEPLGLAGTYIERGAVQFIQATALVPQITTFLTTTPPAVPSLAAFASTLSALQPIVEPPILGRDPDTPGDAVYRTTTAENPFIENPFIRSYSLGTVAAPGDVAALAAISPAAGPQQNQNGANPDAISLAENVYSGQHGYVTTQAAVVVTPINTGANSNSALAAALAQISPAAGPGNTGPGSAGPTNPASNPSAGTPAGAAGGACGVGTFMQDYWGCAAPGGAL